jgi:hypothetical protein
MFQKQATDVTLKNNYLSRDADAAGFLSKTLKEVKEFQLVSGSSLIDAADIDAKTAVTFDFLNHPRPYGRKPDIGAFEYSGIAAENPVQPATKSNR